MSEKNNKKALTSKQRKNNALNELNETFNNFLINQLTNQKITLDDLTEIKSLFSETFNTYKTKTKKKKEVSNE